MVHYSSKMWQTSNTGNDSNKSNLIHEEIKIRLNSGNACYHLFHNLLSSHLLYSNLKIET
jgi:hypothetical protein